MKADLDPHAYRKFHLRIQRERGKASAHQCSVPCCDRSARNWAWTRVGPRAVGMHGANEVTWGLDVSTYSAMCAKHAAQMDSGSTLTHCPRGHERSPANTYTYPDGSASCYECRREMHRERNSFRRACPDCGQEMYERNISRHKKNAHSKEGA